MSKQDARQGADLNQVAKDGTSSESPFYPLAFSWPEPTASTLAVPNDAGKMNTIPSVPNPHQKAADLGLGATSLNKAAKNLTDEGTYDDQAATATGHAVSRAAFEKYSESGGKERNK
ncbi:hypothetical protein F5Y15DRAFT_429524 [Xylariaceae sp. FL0016]|nr:hypothetical protein F5Y15DRAFT_429524 [Xylariaceae sp. FL0016]